MKRSLSTFASLFTNWPPDGGIVAENGVNRLDVKLTFADRMSLSLVIVSVTFEVPDGFSKNAKMKLVDCVDSRFISPR